MKLNLWQWGDVLGVAEESCNNIKIFAEAENIEYMNLTEAEFIELKNKYLFSTFGNTGIFSCQKGRK